MSAELNELILEMEREEKAREAWKELAGVDSELASQYASFKQERNDHVIFFQVGTFYEIWFHDADVASSALGIEKTSRTIGHLKIPMCGVPEKTGAENANRLAKMGHKVALVNGEKNESGAVERKIGAVVTPATITDERFIEQDEDCYILVGCEFKEKWGVALIDTMSGEVATRTCDRFAIFDLIARFRPKEVRLHMTKKWEKEPLQRLRNAGVNDIFEVFYHELEAEIKAHKEKHFEGTILPYGVIAAHYLALKYLAKAQPAHVTLRPASHSEERDYMYLHAGAVSGLDLLENAQTRKKEGSLFGLLDQCATPKGSRTVRSWIQEPKADAAEIERRHAVVGYFLEDEELRSELRECLGKTADLERIVARFETAKQKEQDLVMLLQTLESSERFFSAAAEKARNDSLRGICKKYLEKLKPVAAEARAKISAKDVVAFGYDAGFDEVRTNKNEGLDFIRAYFEGQKEAHGIKMKLEQNQVYGYYFEVTKTQLEKAPSHFVERKKLSNDTKYYVTEELKELEGKYLEAMEKHDSLRRQTVKRIVMEFLRHRSFLRKMADFSGYLDALMGFAELAKRRKYKKPALNEAGEIAIKNGYHPLLQALSYRQTVPNDCLLKEGEIQVVTGPNMGGKSTYLKMAGILTIMAQAGSFVPAAMSLHPVDRILLRMGANDSMLNDQSTFMVEMKEVAYIVYHATKNSLILMDELGRGTSTSDGISIAHTVIEHIAAEIGAKAICSTHYHELIALSEEGIGNISNWHAEAKEREEGVELTFKIVPGGSPKSFGIEVAKRVGLPEAMLRRAQELLETKYRD